MNQLREDDPEYKPRIAILGAGPVGLEAALYARYLGYETAVLEKGTVAENVLRWGHVKMFSPFSMNSSSLGVAALRAQHEELVLPKSDALVTGLEFAQQYLLPLSQTDLLAGGIFENVEVLSIGRDGILKTDARIDRMEYAFRVLVQTAEGEDFVDADVVIDTTGVYDQPNHLGHGGQPARGELDCRNHLVDYLPDVMGSERSRFEGKRILVVGSGYSAATSIVALADLATSVGETKVTWITRRESATDGPIPYIANDRLEHREQLAQQANLIAREHVGISHHDQTTVLAIIRDKTKGTFTVTFGGKLSGEQEFDEVVSCVGFHANRQINDELQVAESPTGQGSRALAEWLAAQGEIDALDLPAPSISEIRSGEPGYYILGSKSFGRNSNFLLRLGLDQIRVAFTEIANRANLDLYATMANLPG